MTNTANSEGSTDREIAAVAKDLLLKVVRSPLLTAADVEAIARVLQVLERLAAPGPAASGTEILPADDSERLLAGEADAKRGMDIGKTYASPPDGCDYCSIRFADRKYFIDGRLRDKVMWRFMCSQCFPRLGAGLGWGSGQLYERQSDGEWLLVAGFRPEPPDDEFEDDELDGDEFA